MVHVISTTPNNISLFTSRSSFITQKIRKSSSQALPVTKYILPLSTSFKLFPQFRLGHISQFHLKTRKISATSADVAVSEASSETPIKTPPNEESTVKTDETRNKRPRIVRKSEMPPVKNEELINGAIFTGKVRSIQPFGAFIDFGAFTDGLVHVSQLSDSFVKDINTVVSIGQEVKVKLVEANIETGRISLTMREKDDTTPRSSPGRSNQRKGDLKKVSKFNKGQDLKGTVKNLTRSGAFISLPEGEEGFLPSSEEVDEGFANIMGGSSLNIGDEINVRVLRINRGQVTLTMKKDEEIALLGSGINLGVVHTATNPFLLAFRSNKEISSFLDERVKAEEKEKVVLDEKTDEKTPESKEQENNLSEDVIVKDEVQIETVEEEKKIASVVPEVSEIQSEDVIAKDEVQIETLEEEKLVDSVPEVSEIQSEDVIAKDEVQIEEEKIISSVPEVSEIQSEDVIAKDEVQIETVEDEKLVDSVPEVSIIQSEDVIAKDEVQIETPKEEKIVDSVPEVTENKSEDGIAKDEVKENVSNTETIITQSPINETIIEKQVEVKEEQIKDTISPALVKQLRDETGAGMMDCKKALKESKGDITLAQEFLRKKGLSSADKKSSRVTAEGRIGSYIHDSRIGVLIEVNCETDFVSRGEIFKNLVEDLAMQVTAYPQVKYLNSEDVPLDIIKKEKEIEMQKEDLLSKPEQIREKIVDGRIKKRIDEQALLEQPYIKNDKIIVKDWIKQTIATIGENIKVKRFVRYNLGEGLEKKSQDFAAEVAAQTTVKSGPAITPLKEESGTLNDTVQKTVISAGLVKQLREETGAGMMDCKKALSESSGDIEKAQEYLRKKGLLTADKKSNRLASEGRIGSYIHDSRIGVLIEVNCETDFVGRSERFKELVDDLAMQVVASLTVKYVCIEDIPESVVKLEKEMEMGRDDLKNKPEGIKEKIVEGRVLKRLGELALLEQVFIKDDKLLVKDLIKQTVAALGENIKLRRFCRFTLGESIDEEKKIGNEE